MKTLPPGKSVPVKKTEQNKNVNFLRVDMIDLIVTAVEAVQKIVLEMDTHPFRFMAKFILVGGSLMYIMATLHIRVDGLRVKVWDSWKEQLKMEEEYLDRHRDDFFAEMQPREFYEPDD